MKVHKWRIKRKYYDLLLTGAKTLEVRVGYGFVRKVKEGDRLTFPDYSNKEFTVLRITRYDQFIDMVRTEDVAKIVPDSTPEGVLKVCYDLYPEEKERLGVYVLELEAPRSIVYLSKLLNAPSFKRLADELYDLTDWICDDYPYHFDHYYNKYLPGLKDGSREIIGCYIGKRPVGVIILKRTDEEDKICTLFVEDEYRGKGVASLLIKHGMRFLGTTTPVITIADYKVPQFEGIIKKYGWRHTETLEKGYYNDRSTEWVFNS